MRNKPVKNSLSRREFIFRTAIAGPAGLRAAAFKEQEAFGESLFKNKSETAGAHPWVFAAFLPKYDITPELEQIFADVKYAGISCLELIHDPSRSEKSGPDLNRFIRGGVDPVDFISTYKSQLVFMHLRDQYKNGKWSESLGEGDTDFKAIGDTLIATNFNGDAIIELAHEGNFKPTRPIRESLKMNREFVRKTIGI